MSELRLFPLQTVLFPGMVLPLRVFEDRYRQLVSECVAAVEPFGVALIRERSESGGPAVPHDVGTTARIESLEHDDGLIHLLAVGVQRFRINELHHDRPYPWADVEYPFEEGTPVPDRLTERLRERYAVLLQLQRTRHGEYIRNPRMPSDPAELTDAAGASLDADAGSLQELLSMFDLTQRTERTVALIDAAIPAAERDARAALIQRRGGAASLN